MSGSSKNDEAGKDAKAGRFSLHNLSAAFARLAGSSTEESTATAQTETTAAAQNSLIAGDSDAVSPRMIVEGMLFVGKPTGEPMTSREMAAHIRDVSPREVESLIDELNDSYAQTNSAYRIESVEQGFRFGLNPNLESTRQRFHGRQREAKLTPPAIEVLSVVAYRQPINAEEVTRLRGTRSHALLNQLVRRGLLQLDRPEKSPRKPVYLTTDRFNTLFRVGSPADLPSSEDLDDC